MGRAAQPRFAVVFLMILTVGLSLRLPAEDVLDAVYDESEALPFEVIPQLSFALRPVAVRTTQSPLSLRHRKGGIPSLFLPARIRDADTRRFADARVSLALRCILLC